MLVLFLFYLIMEVAAKKYMNYTLLRSVPKSHSHLNFLKSLESDLSVDFWKHPGLVGMPVDFLIGPGYKKKLLRMMDENNYDYSPLMENVQSAIDNQIVKSYIRRNMGSFGWDNYYHVNDIYNWMRDLAQLYPNEVSVFSIGTTYENRQILAMKILFKDVQARSTVIIEGGIHAREWISTAFVTYFLNQVIENGKGNRQTTWKQLALTYEWYFVPILNPDGYEFTHTNDRLWRKNRQGGYGVDVNRNFDIAFGSVGVSRFETKSGTYCGTHAFSENESVAIADLIRKNKDTLEYYLAFHSYGQYMIIPYAHTQHHLSNFYEVKEMMRVAKDKLAQRYGTKYTVGTAYDTVGYMTSGVSGDWTKAEFDVRYVAYFELRDEDTDFSYGFILPNRLILPTCYETMDAMEYILTPKNYKYKKLNHLENKAYHDNGQTVETLDIIQMSLLVILNIINWFY